MDGTWKSAVCSPRVPCGLECALDSGARRDAGCERRSVRPGRMGCMIKPTSWDRHGLKPWLEAARSSRSRGSTDDALLPHPNLLRPVRSIAGIAETGHDECTLVEGFVDCSGADRYVGMGSTHPLNALKGADQASKPYLLSPSFFQPVHRRDRSIRSNDAADAEAICEAVTRGTTARRSASGRG
jgi:hypothetical protein